MGIKVRPWEEWEDTILIRNYHNTLARDIAKALGRTLQAVIARAYKLHLKKDREFIVRHAKATGFQKGNVPANKGKKMPFNEKSAQTQFKKGTIPPNTVSVGTEVVDSYGYLKVKVSDNRQRPSRKNWKYVHRMLWEQHHGEIPKGHIVTFRNGDKTDIRIENLECITTEENAKRNMNRYPPELHRITQLIGALNRQINRRERNG